MYSSSFQQIQHFPNWFAVNDLQDCRDMVMWRADMYLSVLSSLPFYINVMNTKLNFHMHVGFACVCTYILTFACEHLNFFFANKQQVSLWVTENIPLFSSIFSHGYQLLAWLPTGLWSQFIEEHWLDLGTSKTRRTPGCFCCWIGLWSWSLLTDTEDVEWILRWEGLSLLPSAVSVLGKSWSL